MVSGVHQYILGGLKIASELEKVEPHEPFYGLSWVGVEPEFQGRGVGRALADFAVHRADETGVPAWYVTFGPNTRALYERRGFVVDQEFHALPDMPVGWTMRRAPSRVTTGAD